MVIPIMAGYPSNLAKKFSLTEQFPQHILPLLPLYNTQWWGYESLTAIVLVYLFIYYVSITTTFIISTRFLLLMTGVIKIQLLKWKDNYNLKTTSS